MSFPKILVLLLSISFIPNAFADRDERGEHRDRNDRGSSTSNMPGYIGRPTIRIQDEPEMRDLSRRVEEANNELQRVSDSKGQFENQVKILENQNAESLRQIESLNREIDQLKQTISNLIIRLDTLKQNPEANKDDIAATEANISSANLQINDRSNRIANIKIEMSGTLTRLNQLKSDYIAVLKRFQDAQNNVINLSKARDDFERELSLQILAANSQGARSGQIDGTYDGGALAIELGRNSGRRDGELDGQNQGRLDGQDRFYKLGADQGERDGSARGKLNGSRDGESEGIRAGNISAAKRDASRDGAARAERSDAKKVGEAGGRLAGLDRASRVGSANGNARGEEETVLKFESTQLPETTISAPYAGIFSRRTPDYPGEFQGPRFNPRMRFRKEILERAYFDGYIFQYREYTRYEFLRNIDREYNQEYTSKYTQSYQIAFNRDYPEYFEKGRIEADQRAYSREYPIAKSQAYKLAFTATDANPQRTSSDYRDTYSKVETDSYNANYEAIRKEVFTRVEAEVFNANIASQTELYRQRRIAEVTKVYNSNAILSFVSSDLIDAGINGIAKLDGVFQPGESVVHSLVLKNFGFAPARNVSVQINNGEFFNVPEIPARSIVVVKGVGISKIPQNAAIGSKQKISLRVVSKLMSDDIVEAIHFDSMAQGILKNEDAKTVNINYPLSLSALKLSKTLLKDEANNLSIDIVNNSKRAYNGELKINLSNNGRSRIITKDFSPISTISSLAHLDDAEIKVSEENDIYKSINLSATISQSGVVLGVLSSDLAVMAKAKFEDSGKKLVVVANSDKNLKDLLDILSDLGGVNAVSVLDLSLPALNANALNLGLNQKVLIVADDEMGSNTKSLNTFISKSKNSTFVFVDEFSAGLKAALGLPALFDATKLNWDKRSVIFSNPHRAQGVEKASQFLQSSLRTYQDDLSLASLLTNNATELLALMKTEINRNSFFTPNDKIKMFSFKTLSEVLSINRAYGESGGIFNRDKKWAKMIEDDQSLFINVIKNATSGDVTEDKLSVILPAISIKDTVSNAMSNADEISRAIKLKIQNTTNGVLNDMEDSFKKKLKNLSKELYNKAYENASIHRPFFIPEREDPNS